MDFNLATLHQEIARVVPDRDCVVWRGQRRSWALVAERARRLANLLLEAGLGVHGDPGSTAAWESVNDHVGLYMYNGPEFLESVLGIHLARCAPFNVNYRYVGAELARLLADARPRALIYHARLAPTLEPLLDGLPDGLLLLQVADDSGHPPLPGALDYDTALAAASPADPATEPSPDDLHIVFTGGTTGLPKGVLWRIGDIVAGPLQLLRRDGTPFDSVDEVLAVARKRAGFRILPAPPFMHGAGLWLAMAALAAGGTVVIQDDVEHFDPAQVLDLAERERVVMLSLVGDAMGRPLVDALDAGSHDLSRLAYLNNSAAPLSPEVKARLLAHLPRLVIGDGLGSSESGHLGSRAVGETFALSDGALVLADGLDRELIPGEDAVGWLCTAGRHARGYLGDPAKTETTFVEHGGRSLVVSGDRARLLADGTVQLLGRDSMTINSGGEKIYAEEVEAALRLLPGIRDAAVLGRPEPRWGSEVVAVIQPEPGSAVDLEAIRAAAGEHLARFKLPRAVFPVDQVRRAPNGKLDYAWARSIVEREGHPGDPVGASSDSPEMAEVAAPDER